MEAKMYPNPERGSGPTISDALHTAAENVKQVHEAIARLEDRIAPILGPEVPPTTGGSLDEVQPVASDIRSRLREHNNVLMLAENRLQGLLSRIEL